MEETAGWEATVVPAAMAGMGAQESDPHVREEPVVMAVTVVLEVMAVVVPAVSATAFTSTAPVPHISLTRST